ncbi:MULTISPECIES: hypothetical protein [unclassified Variovorax]|uniref:hypothetical protein n=1 Tax=unclassified Variovorax TaxID=663243 RepID=UPI001BD5C91E|nr:MULTISPECIES: hypothetical protein [unclassified Variovorax]
MRVQRLLAAVVALCLAGCAQFHKPLSAENRQKIKAVDVRVVVAQDGFMFSATAPGASAAPGGLIGVLIDVEVQKSRQKGMAADIQAMVDPLLDIDFRKEARVALKQATEAAFPLRLQSAEVLSTMPVPRERDERIAATAKGNAYMTLLVQYSLEPGLGAFTTRTGINLWQDGQSERSYYGNAVYQMPLPAGTRAEVLGKLTADDGRLLRSYMRESITETLRMVALDIDAQAKPAAGAAEPKKEPFKMVANGMPATLSGVLVDRRGTRTIRRVDTVGMYSVEQVAQP